MSDDDAERLVEADALLAKGDPRGELIIVQCELARGGFDRAHGQKLRKRERELLLHADEWLAPLRGIATTPIFRRGFVDEITIDAKTYIARETELWELAPRIRWVRMTGLSWHSNIRDLDRAHLEFHRIEPLLEAAFASGRIRWFEPVDAVVTYPYTGEMSTYERSHSFADDIVLWLHNRNFAQLRGLRFPTATEHTLEHLGRFEANLEAISVTGDELIPRYRPNALAQTRLRPRHLGLISDNDAPKVMRTPIMANAIALELGRIEGKDLELPPEIRHLRAKCHSPQYQLATILASPGLSTLEELIIRSAPIGISLRRPEVDLTKLPEPPRLDALRILRLEHMTAKNLDAFLTSSFAQRLEVLDIDGNLYFP